MSTEMQKSDEGKKKFQTQAVTPQEDTEKINIASGPNLLLVVGGEKFNVNTGDLPFDVNAVGDRDLIKGIADYIKETTGKELNLREHRVVRVKNGNIMVTPPAVYG